MIDDVYICHTPYHLLISLAKVLTNPERKSTGLIVANRSFIGDEVLERMKEAGIFDSVILHEDADMYSRSYHETKNPLKRRHILKNIINEFHIEDLREKNIYIFNDDSSYGISMNFCKIPYHLIEDGLNCFQAKYFVRDKSWKKRIAKIVQKAFGIDVPTFGDSPNMIDIEVNDKEGVNVGNASLIIELPRKELFDRLTEQAKRSIVDIFLGDELKHMDFNKRDSVLILTQPLEKSGLMTMDDKLGLYEKIIKENKQYDIFIKVHPREDSSVYQDRFPECHMFSHNNVPIEVFSFISDAHFSKAITVFSTSMESLSFVDQKIVLGKEWVHEQMENVIIP